MSFAFALGACGGAGGSANRGTEYMSLRTSSTAQYMALSTNGQISGPDLQLAPTATGYRGMARSELVDLRSDGKHIVGTIHDQPVDLHLRVGADGLMARGMFGGRLGRLHASNVEIKASLGYCSYELEAKGTRYEGQSACGRSRIPIVRPAAIELPPGFERLPPDRQTMLLAIMLSQ